MKNAIRTNRDQLTGRIFLLVLVSVITMSLSPGHAGGLGISLMENTACGDTIKGHSDFRLMDVAPRITDSGKCHFFLRDGEVLFIDPGYIETSYECLDSGSVVSYYPGLVFNKNISQHINTKFLYHE